MAWHRDDEILVTGGIDNIRVWNVKSGQVLQRISIGRADKNKETLVWCLAFTSDFNIISGDSRGKVSVWNSELGTLVKVSIGSDFKFDLIKLIIFYYLNLDISNSFCGCAMPLY
jgi:WD40 repeat protein